MSSQDVILGARVAHVRELKAEVAKLKETNAALRDEMNSLKAHFDLALLASIDLAALPAGGKMVIIDGWNKILGANRTARDRDDLLKQAKAHTEKCPDDFVWIVFDGPRASSQVDGRVRVSYTGGTGLHRADKMICDFLRMARWIGKGDKVEVLTDDKDFLKEIKCRRGRLQACP